MSRDRSVATDALEVLGIRNLGGKDVGRDAIHLAVLPAVAGGTLAVGANIRRGEDGLWYWAEPESRQAIVDPFLLGRPVARGERFLAIVPPRQITSLRHVWEHPDFPPEESTTPVRDGKFEVGTAPAAADVHLSISEELLRNQPGLKLPAVGESLRFPLFPDASEDDVLVITRESKSASRTWLLEFAQSIGTSYESLVEMLREGVNNISESFEVPPEAYRHLRVAEGIEVSEENRQEYFSCAC